MKGSYETAALWPFARGCKGLPYTIQVLPVSLHLKRIDAIVRMGRRSKAPKRKIRDLVSSMLTRGSCLHFHSL